MMAVDLQSGDSSLALPSQFLPDKLDDALSQHHNFSNNNTSALNPHGFGSHITSLLHSTEVHTNNDNDDDFIAHLTRQMAHSMFQDDDKFDFQGIGSPNLELSWDLSDSPQSTLWSPLGSNQGSPEGPSLEPTPPATPGDFKDSCLETTYDVGMFEKMNLDERGHSKYLHGYGNQSFNHSNVGLCSNQSLIDQQIRALQFSRLKQEQFLKQKNTAYRDSEAQIPQQTEPKEQIQQVQKKGKGCGVGSGNGRRNRPQPMFSWNTRAAPLQQNIQESGSGMRAVFLGGSGSRSGPCGTGVFLPRGTSAPSESRKKPGCSTVLIPARVVQALQLHFDQMAATSGPKAGGFPPLHDVLVSNKDGMYSLQKRQLRKEPANIQKEMMLPQEWTY